MPTISVKKPFTVLVGIILVLVLGVVAFTKMTTDLLPNMDLPYMVVYATDPGASPESVEGEVTKPLESALGSTTGLKNITSTSNENVGIVVLEFEQGTDMNAVSIEMSNTIDQIKGSLPENSGTPVMMQITPDMLPVLVASVDVDGQRRQRRCRSMSTMNCCRHLTSGRRGIGQHNGIDYAGSASRLGSEQN